MQSCAGPANTQEGANVLYGMFAMLPRKCKGLVLAKCTVSIATLILSVIMGDWSLLEFLKVSPTDFNGTEKNTQVGILYI